MKNKPKPERQQKKRVKAIPEETPPPQAVDDRHSDEGSPSSASGPPPGGWRRSEALLQQIAPAGALVNGQGDIFYLYGRTGLYLEPAPGVAGSWRSGSPPRHW